MHKCDKMEKLLHVTKMNLTSVHLLLVLQQLCALTVIMVKTLSLGFKIDL